MYIIPYKTATVKKNRSSKFDIKTSKKGVKKAYQAFFTKLALCGDESIVI
jgi:hypothetical protein